MSHSITKVENKNQDWKVVEILNAAGDLISNVSVNRTNKKGEIFPGFDEIVAGAKVEGSLWESPNGKTYLFAPKGGNAAPRRDQGPAAQHPATQELKNMLTLQVIPLLIQIDVNLKKLTGASKNDYPQPNNDDVPF